jgi:hypothetical protein
MCLAAGESVALVTTIGSAQAIVQTIAKETEQILERMLLSPSFYGWFPGIPFGEVSFRTPPSRRIPRLARSVSSTTQTTYLDL